MQHWTKGDVNICVYECEPEMVVYDSYLKKTHLLPSPYLDFYSRLVKCIKENSSPLTTDEIFELEGCNTTESKEKTVNLLKSLSDIGLITSLK